MKEILEQDLEKFLEIQRVTQANLERLDALITYIQEKLQALQAEAKENENG